MIDTDLISQVFDDDLCNWPPRQGDGRQIKPASLLLHGALLLGRAAAGHKTEVRAEVKQSFD